MSYDPKSRELAEHFLQDYSHSPAHEAEYFASVEELSQQIQNAVEAFMADLLETEEVPTDVS